jgi:hypothetical protein
VALLIWQAWPVRPPVTQVVNPPGKVRPETPRPKPPRTPATDVVRLAGAREHDGITGYRLVDIQRDGSDWRCNIEIDYTYDKRHHPVSVVGGTVEGRNVHTREWGFWGDRGDESDEGSFKRGTRRVSMAVVLGADEAESRELHLFIAAGDPPDPVFYIRKFPFVRTWKRP